MPLIKYMAPILLLISFSALGQYQSSPAWSFGFHAGINFTGTAAQASSTNIYTHSAVSSTQCDASGNVLFYANSFRIWDRQGNPMSGSVNPLWTSNYISGWNLHAMIIPHPTDTNQYYVFQTFPSKGDPPYGPYFVGQLTYSLVDMSLNNGLGDVVPGKNHVLLDKNVGHYMTIIPGNHCNHWVVVQHGQTGTYLFKTYEVNGSGIDTTPVQSYFQKIPSLFPGTTNSGVGCRVGHYVYSYTRNKLIAAYESNDITAYDFDRSSGKISNPLPLTWAYPAIAPINTASLPAICLSPDESQLYVLGMATSTGGAFQLRQFPLSGSGASFSVGLPVVFPVNPQMLLMQQSTGFYWQQSAMQLGADQKIYIAYTLGQNFMGRIEQPDLPGSGCNFIQSALQLEPGTYTTSGLPAPMYNRKTPAYKAGIRKEIALCFEPSAMLKAPDTSYTFYKWDNGNSGKYFTAPQSGQYVLTSSNGDCDLRNDTFDVNLVNFYVTLGPDIKTCETISLFPSTTAPPPINYLWSNGSTSAGITVTAGTHIVTVSGGGCSKSDTIQIDKPVLQLHLPADTSVCEKTSIRLDATINGASYIWQDGSNLSYFDTRGKGLYYVQVKIGSCEETDTTIISEIDCEACLPIIPTAFTPNGDGRNDGFKPLLPIYCNMKDYNFRVYNRWGQEVFHSTKHTEYWNGTYNGGYAEAGTYMFRLEYTTDTKKQFKGDVMLIR
jgi:gliding motility-associated-like protein